MDPADPIDLDVGAPMVSEDVDWFGERADAAAATVATPTIDTATFEDSATARMPGFERTATVRQPPLERAADVTDPTIDDEGHTLTNVELDMLREDYEAEHTMTQQTNKELRDAIADLKATQAARAANSDTATLEMPQQPAETESQRARKLGSR